MFCRVDGVAVKMTREYAASISQSVCINICYVTVGNSTAHNDIPTETRYTSRTEPFSFLALRTLGIRWFIASHILGERWVGPKIVLLYLENPVHYLLRGLNHGELCCPVPLSPHHPRSRAKTILTSQVGRCTNT
jgi:hypothetical protein